MMKKYEEDDIVTFYFVTYEKGNEKCIRGWTDNKDLADVYMHFHSCKYYRMKKMKDSVREIYKIIEENTNDEIQLYSINTRGKRGSKSMMVPMTLTEFNLLSEESNTFLSSRVNYGYINDVMYYLKGKYRDALEAAGLVDIIKAVLYGKNSKFIENTSIDNLMVLFMSLPDQFGE